MRSCGAAPRLHPKSAETDLGRTYLMGAIMCRIQVCSATLVAAALVLWSQAAQAQTVIDTVQQLEAISSNLSGSYVLGANINASATAGWNNGTGFAPIGNLTNPFTGTFDGDGYTISNLTINSSQTQAGLFAAVGSTGTIEQVGLSNVSVTQTASGLTGGLVGLCRPRP